MISLITLIKAGHRVFEYWPLKRLLAVLLDIWRDFQKTPVEGVYWKTLPSIWLMGGTVVDAFNPPRAMTENVTAGDFPTVLKVLKGDVKSTCVWLA